MSKYLWVLDPGHGGRNETEGKRSPLWPDKTQYFEGEGNRQIVKKVSEKLHRYGVKHVFTVNPDDMTDLPLPKRSDFINGIQGDTITVSVHSDGFGDEAAHGHTVYTSEGETDSDKVATVFHEEAVKLFPGEKFRMETKDGDPDKESQFWILRKTKGKSILLENFFHTNQRECKKILMTEEGQNKIVQYIVNSILRIEKHGF